MPNAQSEDGVLMPKSSEDLADEEPTGADGVKGPGHLIAGLNAARAHNEQEAAHRSAEARLLVRQSVAARGAGPVRLAHSVGPRGHRDPDPDEEAARARHADAEEVPLRRTPRAVSD